MDSKIKDTVINPAHEVNPPGKKARRRVSEAEKRAAKARLIERDYLARLGNEVTSDKWERIVGTAIEQAVDGDRHAREWLSKYVLPQGMTLLELAKEEFDGVTTSELVKKFIHPVFTQARR